MKLAITLPETMTQADWETVVNLFDLIPFRSGWDISCGGASRSVVSVHSVHAVHAVHPIKQVQEAAAI